MKTDEQLRHDVIAELKWEPGVQSSHVNVSARQGVITLTGKVSSFAEKWHAEQAAQRVQGVKALVVELNVKLPLLSRRTDASIAESATHILASTSSLMPYGIKVLVEDGWLTLIGAVEWQFQRQDAMDCVRHLTGITGISNGIVLRPRLSAASVKSDIEAALRRKAAEAASHIAVDVAGNAVTLTGSVHSWAERDLAHRSAWASAGVGKVIDQLSVAA